MLDEETKALIKGYVRQLLAEAKEAKPPLSEVFTLTRKVRATNASGNGPIFVDLEPGPYLVTSSEVVGDEEVVTLSDPSGKAYPPLVSKKGANLTHLGKALFEV